MSLLSTIIQDLKEGPRYKLFVDNKHEVKYNNLGTLQFVVILDLIILILVQIKIEIYVKSIDLQIEECEQQQRQDVNFNYSKGTVLFVLFSLALLLIITIYYVWKRNDKADIYLFELRIRLISQFILAILIPIVLIRRNPNIYKFCLKKVQRKQNKIGLINN